MAAPTAEQEKLACKVLRARIEDASLPLPERERLYARLALLNGMAAKEYVARKEKEDPPELA